MTGSIGRVVGRYAIHDVIASGGMATVHYGRLVGEAGFARTVAIKRLHPHLASQPEFVRMFLDEARIAARIRHPNVVPMLDVANTGGEIFLVMEYVAGESLARLFATARERGERVPVGVAASIVVGVLRGLHAAHEATGEHGESLGIVHRDVSPQNVLVGRDGVAHVLDFGVAKAGGQLQATTREGRIKGKVAYMPPEQVRGGEITRRIDVYAAGVVLWELLVGDRLFGADNEATVLERVLFGEIPAPSSRGAPAELDEVVLQALSRSPEARFTTAREMARAIEAEVSVAPPSEVAEWLEGLAGEALAERQRRVTAIESGIALEAPATPSAASREGDISNVASTADPERPVPRRRRPVLALLVIAAAGGLAVVVGMRARSHGPAVTNATAPVPPPSASAPTAAASLELPVQVASAAPSASTTPAPPAALTTQTPPPRTPSRRGPSKATPIAAPPASAGRPNCNPPYVVDADGVKQYKVECL